MKALDDFYTRLIQTFNWAPCDSMELHEIILVINELYEEFKDEEIDNMLNTEGQ